MSLVTRDGGPIAASTPHRERDSMMPQPKPRTQFRVHMDLYAPVEGIRKEYERYRFFHQQNARRVTTELIIRTLLEHAGILPKPTEGIEGQRHIDVMRIIGSYRHPNATDAPPTPKAGQAAEAG